MKKLTLNLLVLTAIVGIFLNPFVAHAKPRTNNGSFIHAIRNMK
jgi:hypothetical protein